MVKIRLRRVGARNKPMYRVVVADARSPRDGAFIEVIGHYNPLTEPATFAIDEEKALKWLSRGAKPTNTALSLLTKAGIMEKLESVSAGKVRAAKSEKVTTTTESKSTTEESSQ